MKVIIDPARGGNDTGVSGGGITEKDWNLTISKYIYNILKNNGIEAYLTRTEDIDIPEAERATKIKNYAASSNDIIVISNRLNEGKDDGAEIIYPLRSTDNLAKALATALENTGQNVNKYYQRRLPSDLASDYDYIIRNTSPYETLIINYGYVDSPEDDVTQLKNYQRLGDAIASAIISRVSSSGTYTVKTGDTLYSIAKKYNVSVNALKTLNNLSTNTLRVGQKLKIPAQETTTPSAPTTPSTNTYTVKRGDTLYGIARDNNTTVDTLKSLNNLTTTNLSIGQTIKLPTSSSSPSGTPNTLTYTIKKGDTLYGIATKYNTTISAIKSLNNLDTNTLTIGKTLKIPTTTSYTTYTVKKGDNLYTIARKYNTTVNNLVNLNNLKTTTLSIGQTLKVPL